MRRLLLSSVLLSSAAVAQVRQAPGLELGANAFGDAQARASWQSQPIGPFSFMLNGAAASIPFSDGRALGYTATATLSARIRSGGFWFGASQSDAQLHAALGAWHAVGRALITLSLEPAQRASSRRVIEQHQIHGNDSVWTDTSGWHFYPTTVTRTDTSNESMLASLPSLALRADWAHGRWSVTAAGVKRLGEERYTTGSLSVTVSLTTMVGVTATVGSAARGLVEVGEPSRFVSAGIRVWPSRHVPSNAPVRAAATAFRIVPAADSTYRVTLRVPGGRTVEVAGDFSNWEPVPLRESSAGVWETTVRMAPGVHRVNVRVNGDRWTAPPGTPTVNDDFAGRVGLIVVK
ncbi:MAG TPA: glycogen-binding domain-containing protein [Gemmatimonadaceae bacterium]|nr:glycogen-binding domain-containing protein [Gemmatimonadaceae bacterium]